MTATPAASPPWVLTAEQTAMVEQAKARLTADLAVKPRVVYCEVHDGPSTGGCGPECLTTAQMMSGDGYSEPRVYSDYLGGTSSTDVSGCHGSPPMPETETYLAAAPECGTGYLMERTVHPSGCMCGAESCPEQIAEDAYWSVVGEERAGEAWALTETGWERVS